MQLQAQIFSDCKHHGTTKTLVGISPRGCTHFFQSVRGVGHQTIILPLTVGFVDPNDQWMADRGFLVRREILQHGGELTNLRIHVETAIQRIKCFRFLKNQIPLTHLPILDDVLTIVGALCNL